MGSSLLDPCRDAARYLEEFLTRSVLPHSFSKPGTSPSSSPTSWARGIRTLSLMLQTERSLSLASGVDLSLPNGRVWWRWAQTRAETWNGLFRNVKSLKKFVLCSHSLPGFSGNQNNKSTKRNTEQFPCHGIFYLLQIWRHILNRTFFKKTSSAEVSFRWITEEHFE